MNHAQTGDVLFYALLLMLPLSSLVARRMPIGQVAKLAAAWLAIFAGLLLIVTMVTRAGFSAGSISDALGLSDQRVRGGTVEIPMAPDGHFWTTVSINGVPHRMLIDSGATVTAIPVATARAAGIDPAADKFGTIIETANGPAAVRRGIATDVRLGTIDAHNLDIQIGDNFGDDGVIGMNFLSRLKSWRVEGSRMILEAKH